MTRLMTATTNTGLRMATNHTGAYPAWESRSASASVSSSWFGAGSSSCSASRAPVPPEQREVANIALQKSREAISKSTARGKKKMAHYGNIRMIVQGFSGRSIDVEIDEPLSRVAKDAIRMGEMDLCNVGPRDPVSRFGVFFIEGWISRSYRLAPRGTLECT